MTECIRYFDVARDFTQEATAEEIQTFLPSETQRKIGFRIAEKYLKELFFMEDLRRVPQYEVGTLAPVKFTLAPVKFAEA